MRVELARDRRAITEPAHFSGLVEDNSASFDAEIFQIQPDDLSVIHPVVNAEHLDRLGMRDGACAITEAGTA